jgi:tyrosine-protein phosphatase YwqE
MGDEPKDNSSPIVAHSDRERLLRKQREYKQQLINAYRSKHVTLSSPTTKCNSCAKKRQVR